MKKSSLFVVSLLAVSITLSSAGFAGRKQLGNDVVWVKRSATYKCCVQQAYLNGMNRLRDLVKDKKPGTWCVVLDADETVISNVIYQMAGLAYSKKSWNDWCKQAAAPALPGAKEFCALAQELGGKVIILTNRQGDLKEVTEKNLRKIDFPYDILLLREGPYAKDRTKVMRREAIRKGTVKTLPAGVKLPPLEIAMLAGDQTHDLYDSYKLNFEDIKERFGRDFIILPNPMYGDWASPPMYADPGIIRARLPSRKKPSSGDARPAPGVISWQEAMDKVGENVVVETEIVSVYDPASRGKGGPVKLNTSRDWNEGLTIILFNKDGSFGDPDRFNGKKVRASGKIGTYHDAVQLTIGAPDDIEIVEE